MYRKIEVNVLNVIWELMYLFIVCYILGIVLFIVDILLRVLLEEDLYIKLKLGII